MKFFRMMVITASLLGAWHMVILISKAPAYILPMPFSVLLSLQENYQILIDHAAVTFFEIIIGMIIGSLFGCLSALILISFKSARQWLLPIFIISQAIPVFAIAPLLVLWLGYGLSSKIAMASLIIYFPVTASFYDGLRQTPKGLLDLAFVMGAKKINIIRYIQIPAALPALASGLRVAAAVSPIGVIVGEWVGSSQGLGFLMLHANSRMQIDLMFAALLLLAIFSVCFYFIIDKLLRHVISWHHIHSI